MPDQISAALPARVLCGDSDPPHSLTLRYPVPETVLLTCMAYAQEQPLSHAPMQTAGTIEM